MKFIFPCIMARIANRAASGNARSVFVAPARGGTSGHKLLTVPALESPVRVSVNRQEIATASTRIKATIGVAVLMFTSGRNLAMVDRIIDQIEDGRVLPGRKRREIAD